MRWLPSVVRPVVISRKLSNTDPSHYGKLLRLLILQYCTITIVILCSTIRYDVQVFNVQSKKLTNSQLSLSHEVIN